MSFRVFCNRYGDTIECSEQAIIRLNQLTNMYIDFQGPIGKKLSPETLEEFLNFLKQQLLCAAESLSHLEGLKTSGERSIVVNMYVESVEMEFQCDESFIVSPEDENE